MIIDGRAGNGPAIDLLSPTTRMSGRLSEKKLKLKRGLLQKPNIVVLSLRTGLKKF